MSCDWAGPRPTRGEFHLGLRPLEDDLSDPTMTGYVAPGPAVHTSHTSLSPHCTIGNQADTNPMLSSSPVAFLKDNWKKYVLQYVKIPLKLDPKSNVGLGPLSFP